MTSPPRADTLVCAGPVCTIYTRASQEPWAVDELHRREVGCCCEVQVRFGGKGRAGVVGSQLRVLEVDLAREGRRNKCEVETRTGGETRGTNR